MIENYIHLIKDPAHWVYELTLMLIFDVIVGLIIWPFILKILKHHKSDHERIEDLEREMKKVKGRINTN